MKEKVVKKVIRLIKAWDIANMFKNVNKNVKEKKEHTVIGSSLANASPLERCDS